MLAANPCPTACSVLFPVSGTPFIRVTESWGRTVVFFTQEDAGGVAACPRLLRLVRVQRETHAIAAVEVPEGVPVTERGERQDEAKNPDAREWAERAFASGTVMMEGENDAHVLLQRHVRQHHHRHLRGEQRQGANQLTGQTLHPDMGMTIILPAVFHIESADEKKVHAHQTVRTYQRTRT